MNRICLMLLALVAAAGFCAEQQSSFTVTGFGRVFYEPDSFDLSFGVTTDDPDVQKCKEKHLAALAGVKDFLDKHKEKTISLKQDVTRLDTAYRDNPRQRVFRFATSYVARIKDVQSLPAIQEGLISSGVTDIHNLDLFSEKLPQLTEQARKEAISDAKRKAELAAGELGWNLTGASSISFQERDGWGEPKASSQFGSRTYAYDKEKRPDLTNYVSSQVSVVFTFEKKK
jgi:uncharacterized protein YggE